MLENNCRILAKRRHTRICAYGLLNEMMFWHVVVAQYVVMCFKRWKRKDENNFFFLLRNLGVLLHLPFFLYVPPLLSTVSHSSNYFTNNAKKGTNCSDQPSQASIQCQNPFYFVSGGCSSHLLHTSTWSKHDTSRPLLNSLNHQKVFSYIKLKSASLRSHPHR